MMLIVEVIIIVNNYLLKCATLLSEVNQLNSWTLKNFWKEQPVLTNEVKTKYAVKSRHHYFSPFHCGHVLYTVRYFNFLLLHNTRHLWRDSCCLSASSELSLDRGIIAVSHRGMTISEKSIVNFDGAMMAMKNGLYRYYTFR